MKNLLKTVKKTVKKVTEKEEWYWADMLTAKGEPYKTGVKAFNRYEAAGKFILHSPKGNVLIDVKKGEL